MITPTTMIRPLTTEDLTAAAQLTAGDRYALLGHLRWQLHTPYAAAFVLEHKGRVIGVACCIRHGSSAHLGHLFIQPEHRRKGWGSALVQHLITHCEASGRTAQSAQVPEGDGAFWQAHGFHPQGRYVRYTGGLHIDASRDEVLLLEPPHMLALLHLDQRATGEDRRALLLEHRFVAHVYVDQGQVRGGMLPLLGHGLVLADSPAVGLELQRWLLPHQAHLVVPEANAAACAHLQERKYVPSSAGVRMVRGPLPNHRPELIYAWPCGL
jgi:GNAT superfamily N-acetyltransferase